MIDATNVPLTPTTQADVREPISSGCTANPFNGDGTTCQGGAVGTPFFLFTNGTSPPNLFANAYQPNTPATGGASGVTTTSATVNGSVATNGAAVSVSFQFGTTTAYGHTTPAQKTAPDGTPAAFSATLSGLPANSTVHYRAVATSDFGTFTGPDRALRTAGGSLVGACLDRSRERVRNDRERPRRVLRQVRRDVPAVVQADRHRDAARQEDRRDRRAGEAQAPQGHGDGRDGVDASERRPQQGREDLAERRRQAPAVALPHAAHDPARDAGRHEGHDLEQIVRFKASKRERR